MKNLLVLLFVCNQQIYDSLYKQISIAAIEERLTMQERIDAIEKLRALCRGQKSTFERCNPLNNVGGKQ